MEICVYLVANNGAGSGGELPPGVGGGCYFEQHCLSFLYRRPPVGGCRWPEDSDGRLRPNPGFRCRGVAGLRINSGTNA